jgi:hypothetical protein
MLGALGGVCALIAALRGQPTQTAQDSGDGEASLTRAASVLGFIGFLVDLVWGLFLYVMAMYAVLMATW